MKKITALFISATLLMSTAVFAEPNVLTSEDGVFEYTTDGVVTAYYGEDVFVAPAEIDGIPIVKIGDKLCFDLDISTVYMEDGIGEIGESAFEGCNAVYADIAATVKNVGDRAFANCENLEYAVLYSTDVSFGYDAFMGTGYIYFTVPCTANEAELEALAEKISDAKGDPYFGFNRMHTAITESMEEKDIFGESMIYCEACGFKGSRYLEDIELPFSDVSADAWYYAYVQTAYSLGIINGKSETEFDPNAGMTCAEAVKIAACIHEYQTGDVIDSTAENWVTWYDPYFTYCYDTGIIEEDVYFEAEARITRAQMAYLFSRCDAENYYVNEVPLTDIPDVEDTTAFAYEILDLYNKGIAVGSDEYYTYYPDSEIKRCEAAALISRILCWEMRIELPKG